MTELVTKCLVCMGEGQEDFDTSDFKGHKIRNVICKTCGFVFQSPRMTEKELDNFYKEQYRTMYQGDEGPSVGDLNTQKSRALSLLSMTKKIFESVNIHLDIGSSSGELIRIIKNNYGNVGIGIEPGKAYRDHAISQGINTYESLEKIPKIHLNKIGLVSLGHVLEHLDNPIDYLKIIRKKYLSPKGHVLIEVPNLYFHDSFEVAHLSAFTTHSLNQTLRLAGYRIIYFKKHGNPRSKLFPLYLTAIATPMKPIKKTIKAEKVVVQKRQLSMFVRKILSRLFPKSAWLPKE
jgi:hypothetical protein